LPSFFIIRNFCKDFYVPLMRKIVTIAFFSFTVLFQLLIIKVEEREREKDEETLTICLLNEDLLCFRAVVAVAV